MADGPRLFKIRYNSAANCWISLKFGTGFDHVIAARLKRSRSKGQRSTSQKHYYCYCCCYRHHNHHYYLYQNPASLKTTSVPITESNYFIISSMFHQLIHCNQKTTRAMYVNHENTDWKTRRERERARERDRQTDRQKDKPGSNSGCVQLMWNAPQSLKQDVSWIGTTPLTTNTHTQT